MKIVFFGTSQFAVPTLQNLAENFNIGLVITKPPKPAGRGKKLTASAINIEAEKLKLPIECVEKFDDNTLDKIKKVNAELFIVVDFGKIIPQKIIDMPVLGTINIHPSKLPLYRGPSPIQSAILNGDKKTAISIMLIDKKMDHGPILAQKSINITESDTSETLFHKLSMESADFLIETLKRYINNEIKAKPQNHTKSTYTKIITKEDGKVDFNKSAKEIHNMVRAFYPWPGTYTKYNDKILKILSTSLSIIVTKKEILKKPGEFFKTKNNQLAVVCKKGVLILEKVQPEGKKPMSGEDFICGYLKGLSPNAISTAIS